MYKNGVLGFLLLVTGLLIWSCGSGSVDSLSDTEMLMISRFPSTIDYDLLDSIVEVCKSDNVCWEKAKKTGEIYTGDYKSVLLDSSGNIIFEDSSGNLYIYSSGSRLPIFSNSSQTRLDDEEEELSSASGGTGSASSSTKSSASIDDEDEDYDDEDDESSSSVGGAISSVTHVRSSSSSKTANSSSVDLSFLSSSSKKVASSSSINIDLGSSSSKTVISVSSVSQSSSSQQVVVLSSSSIAQHTGGGGQGNTGTTCGEGTLSGTCTVSPNPGVKNKNVTYTFTPDGSNSCDAYDNVEWNVTSPSDGASENTYKPTYNASQPSYTFSVSYSLAGDKKSVIFSMGGQNKQCDAVEIKADCNTANSYSCSRTLNSASNNLTKSNPVSYTWELNVGGCYEVTSISWSGAVSGSNASVTQSFTATTNASVSVTVKDESGISKSVSCENAYVRNENEEPPTCSVEAKVGAVGESVSVTPSSIVGCDYDSDKCSYVLKKTSGGGTLASGSGYSSGTLNKFSGESNEGIVNYTLSLTNNEGTGSCSFDVQYVEPTPVSVSTSYVAFTKGVYSVTIGGSEVRNGFGCTISGSASSNVIGSFNGVDITSGSWGNLGTKIPVTLNATYLLVLSDQVPSGLKCGIGW